MPFFDFQDGYPMNFCFEVFLVEVNFMFRESVPGFIDDFMHFPEEVIEDIFPLALGLEVHLILEADVEGLTFVGWGFEEAGLLLLAPAPELGEHAFEVAGVGGLLGAAEHVLEYAACANL